MMLNLVKIGYFNDNDGRYYDGRCDGRYDGHGALQWGGRPID